MKYATAAAFRTALEQRLLNLSREADIPLIRLRKIIVFDRLIARLVAVAPDRWLLKGAAALIFRIGPTFRTTKDLDLGRWDDEQAATQDFIEAQSLELDDHFDFTIEVTDRVKSEEGKAVRYHATANLGGRKFEDITIDVGFAVLKYETSEALAGLDLLGFADIEPVQLLVLAIEDHVAQKVHAYTKTYGSGIASTRTKDLIDLVLISQQFDFRSDRLRQALVNTFEARDTHVLPPELPPPPADWEAPYQKMAAETGLVARLDSGYQSAANFLNPILGSSVPGDSIWSASNPSWQVP